MTGFEIAAILFGVAAVILAVSYLLKIVNNIIAMHKWGAPVELFTKAEKTLTAMLDTISNLSSELSKMVKAKEVAKAKEGTA